MSEKFTGLRGGEVILTRELLNAKTRTYRETIEYSKGYGAAKNRFKAEIQQKNALLRDALLVLSMCKDYFADPDPDAEMMIGSSSITIEAINKIKQHLGGEHE